MACDCGACEFKALQEAYDALEEEAAALRTALVALQRDLDRRAAWPKHLYQKRSGQGVMHLLVSDALEEAAARAAGWED